MRCGSGGPWRRAEPAAAGRVVRSGSCSLMGGTGGASDGRAASLLTVVAPRGPRGSSSTAWRRVGWATRRRGVMREARVGVEADGAVDGVAPGVCDSAACDDELSGLVLGALSAQGSSIVAGGLGCSVDDISGRKRLSGNDPRGKRVSNVAKLRVGGWGGDDHGVSSRETMPRLGQAPQRPMWGWRTGELLGRGRGPKQRPRSP